MEEMTLHDGAGVRLTVFLKGCPLRCAWCHNPEGLHPNPQLFYKKAKCVDCGICRRVCGHLDCKKFGRCLHICPNDCQSVCGAEYDAETLAGKIQSYKRIFDACGGGVTFSGGEPLMQWKFLSDVIDRLNGVQVTIETSGYASKQIFREMLEKVDFVYMDIKLFDGALHKKYTGADNALIKSNFAILKESGVPFTVRTPLIGGITDTQENLRAIEEFIGGASWEKLPENKLARVKDEMLI